MNNMLWLVTIQYHENIAPLAVFASQQAATKYVDESPRLNRGSYQIEPVEDRLTDEK
ncbi:hypothetical protein IWT25_00738 [Secundilactobacillus pentosiphilus]|uniref:Uncharacterized protein n=1 Tax=Secundilactobacillus pentosiphilus TaxID=1714682 RepID=A0A1Z5IUJ2_9LACO|nr:hypothetical protein [Secundilactobacillus pentosiphilus]GAX05434.1 hypothetical protein IWT25_00738 [Secundilactobacillus pentosiphilus]